MAQAISLQDTGQRTIGGSAEFNRVNGGTAFTINIATMSFSQGLETDNTSEAGSIGSAGFANPEVGTASTAGGKLAIRGSVDMNASGETDKLKWLAQLARTRGLIKVYSDDTRVLSYHLAYDSLNAVTFTAESTISSSNPIYARVGSLNISQSPSTPFRIKYTVALLIHSE
jgi:hypothetical protein